MVAYVDEGGAVQYLTIQRAAMDVPAPLREVLARQADA
jgi:hypothetical protein